MEGSISEVHNLNLQGDVGDCSNGHGICVGEGECSKGSESATGVILGGREGAEFSVIAGGDLDVAAGGGNAETGGGSDDTGGGEQVTTLQAEATTEAAGGGGFGDLQEGSFGDLQDRLIRRSGK
jgi:hypothetical protein